MESDAQHLGVLCKAALKPHFFGLGLYAQEAGEGAKELL